MHIRTLVAATMLLGSSGYALAADPAMPIEEIPTGFTWTGGYVGAQLGYGWGDADLAYVGPSSDLSTSADPDGVLGGLYVGYNYQFSNQLVLGAEADIAWSNADSGYEPFNGATQASADIDYTAGFRARLGYAVDRWLPYIAGGVAIARGTFNYDMFIQDASIEDTLVGWNLGAGVEYAATDNIIVRAEYRYSDFGDGSENAFSSFPNDEGQYDLKNNDIRIGVAYKF